MAKIQWIPVQTIFQGDNCWGSVDEEDNMTPSDWMELLNKVRRDDQYEDVKASLEKKWF